MSTADIVGALFSAFVFGFISGGQYAQWCIRKFCHCDWGKR